MKKLIFLMMMVFAVVLATAQKPIKATIKVPSLGCEECEAIIENALWKRIDGITFIDAKWKSKIVKVTYIPDRVDLANIIIRIAELGFDADDEKADEAFMKRLPKCCQRVEAPKTTPAPAVAPPIPPPPPPKPVAPTKAKDTVAKKSTVPKTTKPVAKKKG
jgi:copper chaperone CopZ